MKNTMMKNIIKFLIESLKKTNKEEAKHIEGTSILDNVLNNPESDIDKFVKDFIRPNGPTIYAFITNKVKDAIKVGYTDQHPEKRIEQWREIYGKEKGEVECLGWWSSEEFNEAGERVFFWDHAIHKKISDKKFKQLSKDEFMATLTDEGKKIKDIHYSREFFDKYKRLINGELDPDDKEELSAELLEDIIKQMKLNIKNGTADFKLYSFDKEGKTSSKEANRVWRSPDTYSNTDLQEEAIKNGIEAIKDDKKKNILMAAVMRFGKTHASYEIIKQAGLKKVIVCSAKADVRKAWRDDINHIHFYKDFIFIEVKGPNDWDVTYCKDGKTLITEHGIPNIEMLEKSGKTMIYFFTLHDLGGSIKSIKEKHKNIFDKEFDLMVVDETHYGSHANTFGKVTKLGNRELDDDNSDIEEEQKIAKEVENGIKELNVKYKKILQVSGTPYYILASNEMIDKEKTAIISKVSYSDMLNARDKWNKEHANEDPSKSPYFGIPTLHKIGLKLNKECRKALDENGMTGSLSELFKVKGSKFAYEGAIKSLMQSIFGDGSNESLAFLKNKSVEGNKVCKHTLIVLPRINACEKMKDLLQDIIDTKERQVINIVGNNADVKTVEELNNKLEDFDDKGKKSIVLTVNKFLTGVSMPLIDSMIYLKNASSPQEYDQNIFRLCTRHVKTVKNNDEEFKSKKVNMKENVYLIDFNITNMFNMIANSAKMKAAAEGNPTTKRIKELMKEDLGATPIFCEDKGSSEILGKMHKITSKDMMEIYTGYNKNKSIADIVNDEINLFGNLFNDKKFQDAISEIDIEADKSKIDLKQDDEGESIDNIGNGTKKEKIKPMKDFVNNKSENKIIKITKEKFKAITKNLLYCNICLDEPCKDVDSIIDKSKEDKDFQKMLNEFKISVKELKKVYDIMSTNYKQAYNTLLMRMSILAQDTSEEGYEKFSKALKGLGRLEKNEVVTPPEIVGKMIDKLSKEDYEKADSILLVNEKQAEFFMGIYKKFGKKITEKCKIVASSEIGMHLCEKMIKSIGINDYINNIIDIGDVNGDGKYNVNDFLDMSNDEILKKNGGKKINILLMNPPYSKDRFGDGLYIDFLNKCLDISDKVISVNPLNMLISHGVGGALKNKTNKIVKYINEYKPKIEVIDKSLFDAGIKGDLCIISFNGNNENIIINKDSKTYKFKEHKDINFTSDYVKTFKSKLFKYMIGEDINDYIHLKYPKIYTENKEIKIKHDNLYNHLKFNGGEPYAKMNAILDKNPNKDSLFIYIYKINASFAGILYKSLTYNNAVEYNESTFAKGSLLYIELNKNDYKKSENICSYLKTDFCKLITNLAGEYFHPYLRYDFIPWLDFSKEWTDEELFNMIGMKYDKNEISKILSK